MTKLEAWQAWCAAGGTEQLADQLTLMKSSHGKAFSYAWDAAAKAEREACAKVCDDLPAPERMSLDNESLYECATLDCADAIRARSNT